MINNEYKDIDSKDLAKLSDAELYETLLESDLSYFKKEMINLIKKANIIELVTLEKVFIKADFDKEYKLARKIAEYKLKEAN